MKLARFEHNGRVSVGVVSEDRIFAIPAPDNDLVGVAARWREFAIEGNVAKTGVGIAIGEVRLLPPIGRPSKILAIGLNYADHIKESGLDTPDTQTWFAKHVSALNGPFDAIEVPRVSDALDYEAELVVVIGQGGRHIKKEDARAHVFGYCVGNDVSVRDWQLASSQWVLGKSFDTHAPIGPWITTADEVADPHSLGIRCFVNGEKRQDTNTSELVFDIWDQIAHVSQAMTLMPGDLIFTGTSSGVGFALNPPRKLKDSDVVRIEIDGLGAIENRCADED